MKYAISLSVTSLLPFSLYHLTVSLSCSVSQYLLPLPETIFVCVLSVRTHMTHRGPYIHTYIAHISMYTLHSNTISSGWWLLENHLNLSSLQSWKKGGRFPSNIKVKVVASVLGSLHLSPVYSNHTVAASTAAFILLYFTISLFCFRLTGTGSLLPQGNRVMSLISFHSQLYSVLCVYIYVCGTMWKELGGGGGLRNCVHVCMRVCHWQLVAHWKLLGQRGCILFTDHVSFAVVFWLGPSRMLLSCWPPLCSVTQHWKCFNNMGSTLLHFMAMLWPFSLITTLTMHCTNSSVKWVKSLST